MSRKLVALIALSLIAAVSAAAAHGAEPDANAAAACSDYSTQADAQAAADTRDGDGDGIYCESLPCPCASPSGSQSMPTPTAPAPTATPEAAPACSKPEGVQRISFSKTKYRNIRKHYLTAVRRGWPRVLVLNRPGADARRDRLLEDHMSREGYDRDEYPPALGRGKGKGLTRGRNPRGWRANVEFVRSSENRSHGSRLGIKLRRFCNGTKFRYVFYGPTFLRFRSFSLAEKRVGPAWPVSGS